jgi:glycosyltransferase involved in cell wall biosynthesis
VALNLPIVTVGMEELPDLYAERLIEAGYPAARLSSKKLTGIYHLMNSRGFVAVYPLPFWRHFRMASMLQKPTLAVWIGSDVYRLQLEKNQMSRLEKNRQYITASIADSPALVEELAKMGIKADWVPTISKKMHYQPLPIPDPLSILVYLTPERHPFYGSAIISRVVEMLPNVKFTVVGGYDFGGNTPANVTIAGYVDDMDEIYAKSYILLRPTLHDGLSQMVLEALGRGRQVIWSMPFPHCHTASNPEQIAEVVNDLLSYPSMNIEGAHYVAENFTPEQMVSRLRKVAQRIWSE